MPVTRTEEYNDFGQIIDSMDTTVSMIKAFGRMLEYTMQAGENVSDISY